MTFSTHDSVIIPHEKNHGVVHCPSPPLEMNKHAHTHTCYHMKNYKYPHIQWIAGAMGILMIITAIITVMIQDVSLLEIAFYHHNLHKTEAEKPRTCSSIECK